MEIDGSAANEIIGDDENYSDKASVEDKLISDYSQVVQTNFK